MTATVAAVTVAASVPALFRPEMVRALEQDPDAVGQGQWWRLVSPMLVQGWGWGQFAFNVLGIVLAGIALERQVGAVRWLAVHLAGGIGAILATSLLYPHGTDSGSSAAVAGLIGALAAFMLRTRALPPWPALMYSVFFAAYLGALAVGAVVAGGASAGAVVGAVVGSLALPAFVLTRTFAPPAILRRGSTAVVLLGTAAMLAVGDAHGFGLAAGLALGALLTTAPVSPGRRAARASGGGRP